MRCSNCNFENKDGVNFCAKCGEPLGRDANLNKQNKSKNIYKNPNYDAGIDFFSIIKILASLAVVVLIIFVIKDFVGGKDEVAEDNQSSVYSSSAENTTTQIESSSNDSDEDLTNIKTNDDNSYNNDSDSNYNNNTNSSDSQEYIIPYSSERILTRSDIQGFSKKEIKYAKNEIYARNGRKFDTNSIQKYFNSKSWYSGTIDPEDFNEEIMLSDIEYKNVIFLKKIEESM